ncbi:Holliday junction branch migration protein RuvA [Zafaria sp. Z1313]|uniref:Holliday junction branch migration protein RuvA n=1 Tax=unclassified Zafaria TaxID=2828765 RepID=UPI002E7A06B3|nr:Holliday junction branch migration protein RuvA [Zafaria sp. J156]MEE1621101.1 Holliday junction branch migration protein RuvA [Zafaria sp. J156]
MISSLSGTVQHVGLGSAVVDVSGFGMLVQATPQTLSGLHVGRQAVLHTAMVVREDSMTLYGFGDTDGREVFEVLQSVAGIGPRLALAVLAVLSPEDVRIAVAGSDTKTLTRVPGIGPKVAQRMVLELAGKLAPTGAPGSTTPAVPAGEAWRAPVLEALTGLGWSEKDAGRALDATAGDQPEIVAGGNVGEILRTVLRDLGRGSARSGR